MHLLNCNLQGSADGFLTTGWTALTSLSLHSLTAADDKMCSALQLPALEIASIWGFTHGDEVLQLNQLSGSCPQVSQLGLMCSLAQPSEASKQQSGLLNMSRLADLHIWDTSLCTDLDLNLDLPASLTRLVLEGNHYDGHNTLDFFWVLLQAVKCIGRGAQLHTLVSRTTETLLQPAQWGATLVEQYRQLGAQLHGLKELEVVRGEGDPLLSALSAVASSAPSLTRLVIGNDCKELPPICSGSLEYIMFKYNGPGPLASPTPVTLTLLPGCIRLQKVLVRLVGMVSEGSMIRIRCFCPNPTCIAPLHLGAGPNSTWSYEAGIQFLPVAPSTQALQGHTVLFASHAAGPKQPLEWGHVVCPVASGVCL